MPLTQPPAPTPASSWQDAALCAQADPELWFPEKAGSNGTAAKAICNGAGTRPPCPVRDQCLDAALASPVEEDGVWGGLSKRERRRLRTSTGQTPAQAAKAVRDARILDLYRTGLTPHGIAGQLRIPHSTVYPVLARAGLRVRGAS